MKNKVLKRKIPPIPHWRYTLLLDRGGEAFVPLKRYLEEEKISVGLEDAQEDLFEDALYIYTTEPMKKVVQDMILERCGNKVICDVLEHKFDVQYETRVITLFRKFFFDNKTFNTYELAQYLGKDMPQSPPVPGSMRSQYRAFKNGAEIELDMDAALQHMFNQSFFRAQELSRYGWAGDDKTIKHKAQAMNAYKLLKEYNQKSSLPEEFKYEIEYPEDTALDIEDLEGEYTED